MRKQRILSKKWTLHFENIALWCTPLVAKICFLVMLILIVVIMNAGIGVSSTGAITLGGGENNTNMAVDVATALFTLMGIVAYVYWWLRLMNYINKKTKENKKEIADIRAREKGVLVEKNQVLQTNSPAD